MCGVFRNDHHRIPRVWPITVWTHRLVAARFTVCEKLTGALMPVLIGAPVSGHWILINGMGNTLADGLKKFCGGHRQVTSLSLLSPPGPGGGRVRIRPRVRVGGRVRSGSIPGHRRVERPADSRESKEAVLPRPPYQRVPSPPRRSHAYHPRRETFPQTETTPRRPACRDHALGTPTGVPSAWVSASPRRSLGVDKRAAQGSSATPGHPRNTGRDTRRQYPL